MTASVQKSDGRDEPGQIIAFGRSQKPVALDRAWPVEPLPHFLAGLEERHRLLVDRDMSPGTWIAASPRWSVLHRKGTKAAEFDAVPFGHRASDLTKDRVDDVLDVTLIQMWVLGGNALDEL